MYEYFVSVDAKNWVSNIKIEVYLILPLTIKSWGRDHNTQLNSADSITTYKYSQTCI